MERRASPPGQWDARENRARTPGAPLFVLSFIDKVSSLSEISLFGSD